MSDWADCGCSPLKWPSEPLYKPPGLQDSSPNSSGSFFPFHFCIIYILLPCNCNGDPFSCPPAPPSTLTSHWPASCSSISPAVSLWLFRHPPSPEARLLTWQLMADVTSLLRRWPAGPALLHNCHVCVTRWKSPLQNLNAAYNWQAGSHIWSVCKCVRVIQIVWMAKGPAAKGLVECNYMYNR